MKEKELIKRMSKIIIDALDTKGHAGHASRIIDFGHFSPKMFSEDNLFVCRSNTSLRVTMNVYNELGEEKADELAMKIHMEIKKAVFGEDGLLDTINNEHASKKKKKK